MRTLIAILTLLALTACGSDSGSSARAKATSPAFRNLQSPLGTVFWDFTDADIGPAFTTPIDWGGTVECSCTVTLTGNTTSGSIAASCSFVSGGADPGCSSFDDYVTYDFSSGDAEFCDSLGNCNVWQ